MKSACACIKKSRFAWNTFPPSVLLKINREEFLLFATQLCVCVMCVCVCVYKLPHVQIARSTEPALNLIVFNFATWWTRALPAELPGNNKLCVQKAAMQEFRRIALNVFRTTRSRRSRFWKDGGKAAIVAIIDPNLDQHASCVDVRDQRMSLVH